MTSETPTKKGARLQGEPWTDGQYYYIDMVIDEDDDIEECGFVATHYIGKVSMKQYMDARVDDRLPLLIEAALDLRKNDPGRLLRKQAKERSTEEIPLDITLDD